MKNVTVNGQPTSGTEADGVEWYVTECERHFDDLSAVTPSYAFLKGKGLN